MILKKERTILIVDDDETPLVCYTEGIKRTLKMFITILTARSGEEAFDIISENLSQNKKIDIVITDIKMGGINGIKLAQKIRMLDPSIAVLVIGGYGTDSELCEVEHAGAKYLGPKPVKIKTLIDDITEILYELDET